jgi:hypothetical protein
MFKELNRAVISNNLLRELKTILSENSILLSEDGQSEFDAQLEPMEFEDKLRQIEPSDFIFDLHQRDDEFDVIVREDVEDEEQAYQWCYDEDRVKATAISQILESVGLDENCENSFAYNKGPISPYRLKCLMIGLGFQSGEWFLSYDDTNGWTHLDEHWWMRCHYSAGLTYAATIFKKNDKYEWDVVELGTGAAGKTGKEKTLEMAQGKCNILLMHLCNDVPLAEWLMHRILNPI